MNSDQITDEELLDRVADALIALTNVGMGDYDTRLKIEPNDKGALVSLFSGINEMIASLGTEQEKSRAYQRELEEKLETIEKQRAAIRDLSTPILEVWDGVLCLPVVGVMDTARSTEMTASLLQAVTAKGSHATIIDITGIDVMDTRTVDHFIRMARSVRLLGAECALTGMRPYIAQTVVQMGIDLANVVTYRSLREALQHYVTKRRL
jgi:rsbT co-antagonist protein RsbR